MEKVQPFTQDNIMEQCMAKVKDCKEVLTEYPLRTVDYSREDLRKLQNQLASLLNSLEDALIFNSKLLRLAAGLPVIDKSK